MELGLNTYTFRGLERREALALARECGLGAVELWSGHANYLRVGCDPRVVAAEAADLGIRLRAYCIGGLFGLRARVVEDRLARACAFARGLGVDLVTCILDRAAVPLADARATRAGLRIALENHWYTELARPGDVAAALAGCSPAVGAAIDTGHFAFRGCHLGVAARRLGARTLHVHLKVVRRPWPGERVVRRLARRHRMEPALPSARDQLDQFLWTLRALGYRGTLAIEHEHPAAAPADVRAYVARAVHAVGDALDAPAGDESAAARAEAAHA
jgi:sugar phosphate isomerase/epimerase